jgi:hypothetical protein
VVCRYWVKLVLYERLGLDVGVRVDEIQDILGGFILGAENLIDLVDDGSLVACGVVFRIVLLDEHEIVNLEFGLHVFLLEK